MKKIITYHYVKNYSAKFPFFNFLHKDNFIKQVNYFKKNELLKIDESFDYFLKSKHKTLLTFDDGLSDHYYVYKKLLKLKIKAIFFICSYPIIKKDFLGVHKIHLIFSKFNSSEISKALDLLKVNINLDELNFKDKNYQIKNAKNKEQIKKTKIKIYLNYSLRKNKKIIDKLFNHFFNKKMQKKIFKEFYLTRSQIKEIYKSGMIIGAHSYSHKMLSYLNYNEQKLEIQKNISHLSKLLKEKITFFATPYGGKFSFNKNTIKILKKQKIKYIFDVNNKSFNNNILIKKLISRFNCNKFQYGQIYNY